MLDPYRFQPTLDIRTCISGFLLIPVPTVWCRGSWPMVVLFWSESRIFGSRNAAITTMILSQKKWNLHHLDRVLSERIYLRERFASPSGAGFAPMESPGASRRSCAWISKSSVSFTAFPTSGNGELPLLVCARAVIRLERNSFSHHRLIISLSRFVLMLLSTVIFWHALGGMLNKVCRWPELVLTALPTSPDQKCHSFAWCYFSPWLV